MTTFPGTVTAASDWGARLAKQFDVVLHFDETRAVQPLERDSDWRTGGAAAELPERCLTGRDRSVVFVGWVSIRPEVER